MKPEILYEDESLIACVKPAGMPAQGTKSNDEDMISILKNYLYDRGDTDEEPYIAAIHRLDRPVGGIMLFAKNREIAAKLTDQVMAQDMVKYYQAVLTGTLPDFEGEMVDYLLHDTKTNLTRVVKKGVKGAKRAVLYYEVLDEFETDGGPLTYVLIELVTGRHHQIRAQMAAHGAGIWGDTKYNHLFRGKKQGKAQIGLYASRLEFTHPVTGERIILKKEPEGEAFDVIELDEE